MSECIEHRVWHQDLLYVLAAGLLRNLGYKKKECMRQDSTLVYTGGALVWHVSVIFREKKPLPFSEDHDNHIECVMGIGPDMIVFLDYFTKVLGAPIRWR